MTFLFLVPLQPFTHHRNHKFLHWVHVHNHSNQHHCMKQNTQAEKDKNTVRTNWLGCEFKSYLFVSLYLISFIDYIFWWYLCYQNFQNFLHLESFLFSFTFYPMKVVEWFKNFLSSFSERNSPWNSVSLVILTKRNFFDNFLSICYGY